MIDLIITPVKKVNAYANITCGILSPLDFTDTSAANHLLALLEQHDWASPTHIGISEPLQTKYTSRADAIGIWRDPFLWRNCISKLDGSLWSGRGEKHSCIFLRLKPPLSDNGTMLRRFLISCCERFQADFGYIHLTTNVEMADPQIPYDVSYAVDIGLTTQDLKKGIPKLCWAMLFGECYAPVAHDLKKSGAALCEDLSNGQTLMQLTSSIGDIVSDYESFDRIRGAVKTSIPTDFLRLPDGSDARWKPTFNLKPMKLRAFDGTARTG